MPDSADCRIELRPYGGMSALPSKIHQQSPGTLHYPRSVGSHQGFLYQSCGETLGLVLWSMPALRAYPKDRLISKQVHRTTLLVGTCYKYNPYCLQGNSWTCQSQEQHVQPSDPLGLLLSYPKGNRDGLIKDCVHNHLLLSKSSLITKWREIVLCIKQYKQPQMWLFWI